MRKIILFCIGMIIIAGAIQPQRIVHCPTAGITDHGNLLMFASAFPEDGLRVALSLGLWDRLQVSTAYGAMKLVGRGSVTLDKSPGLGIKFRMMHEGINTPAVAIGVETIGFGEYIEDSQRFEHKSRGVYVVASKNWRFLAGNLGIHSGINYSFEQNFSQGFSFYVGMDKDIKDALGFKLEYDLAPGDWKEPYGNGYGYLSAALCMYFSRSGYVTFNFFDILGNIKGKVAPSREFFVFFSAKIF